jgi:hypothetical protein
MSKSLFPLGQILATPGACELGVNFFPYLLRHQHGDWGDLGEEDKAENNFSVQNGVTKQSFVRILSAYHTPDGAKFWIITEADRSATTVLLPSEY